MKAKKSEVKLKSFIVKHFSITREAGKQGIADLDIAPSGIHDPKNRKFQLVLDIKLTDKQGSYKIEMFAVGDFEFEKGIAPGQLSNYFMMNAPALIFPYVRAYISTVTAVSGLSAINLPVMNLTPLRNELEKNIAVVTET